MMSLLKCLLVALLFIHVDCFPEGAPISTCFTQFPKHGTGGQLSDSPYVVKFTPDKYIPGQEVTVEITDPTSSKRLMGIQMAARRLEGNLDEIVGQFTMWPTDKVHAFNCFGGYQNMVTHSKKMHVTKMTLKWKSDENVGDVVFRSTIMEKYDKFWYDVEINLPVDSSKAVEPPKYAAISLGTQMSAVNLDDCGNNKGCFYYPRTCSGNDCIVAATYSYRPTTKDFKFELYSNYDAADYISLGFSDDEVMGHDFTMSCTGKGGKLSVQEGFNPAYFNDRHFNLFSSSHRVAYLNGKLQCEFVVPQLVALYQMTQDKNTFNYTDLDWDLEKEWYLFLAWGSTMPNSDVMAHHHDLPTTSDSKVNLKEKVITYGSSFRDIVKAHGALMMVAWILVTGIVTVVSRHYRDWLPRTRWFGTKVWFQIHRGLAVLVTLLTAIGLLVIFIHYGAEVTDVARTHAIVGLVMTACVGLQIIGGMLRPGGEDTKRLYFNWGHWLLGHTTHILAAATMFLAFGMSIINSQMKQFGFIVLSVWVVVQVLWHLLLEAISRRNSSKGKETSYSLNDGNQAKPVEQEEKKSDWAYAIILVVYLCSLVALCAAAMAAFLLY